MKFETAFRLLTAGVLTVLPTLMFLGLWRGLMALRDDDLVNRTMNGEFGPIPNSPVAKVMLGGEGTGGEYAASRESAAIHATEAADVRCRACGTPNEGYAEYCGNCLDKL